MLFPRFHLWLRDRQTAKFMAHEPAIKQAPNAIAATVWGVSASRIAASMYADQQLCVKMAAIGITPAAPPTPAPTPPSPAPAPSGFSWWNAANSLGIAIIAGVLALPHMQGCSNPFKPGPPPPPTPAPNPGPSKLMVLVVTPNDVSKVPAAQSAIFSSGVVRDYLNTHCLAGTDGKTSEYRVWNENVQIVGESDLWKTAMGRPRKSLPWIIVNYGTGLFEGPLPATVDDTLTLLKRYGG